MRTDPFEERTLKFSTWIYLVLLFSSTIIIVSFNWFNARIESKPIKNLTLSKFEKLEKEYSRALECPCSVIDIPHGSFISISPQFHPICTNLLTTKEWIDKMENTIKLHDYSMYKDIFQAGPTFFTGLQTFCMLMEQIVSDVFFNFNQSSLITNRALSNAELMARVKQILKQFEENTVAEAKRSLALIHSQTVTMYTTGITDISWRRISWRRTGSYLTHFQPVPIEIGNCSCGIHENCKQQLVYYNYGAISNPSANLPEVLHYIPNMYSSCFVTQSLLQSSLECFFKQNCTEPIVNRLCQAVDIVLLRKNSTRFPPETLLEEIIDKMMIETWNQNINYSHYYEQCAPETCTYFVVSRNNAFYAFTVMIGLFGGLSTALRILVPRVVTWIRNRIYRRNNTNNRTGSSTFCERLRAVWLVIKKKLIELNLFESEQSWDNEHCRHREVLTTRLYLLFLVFSLLIIIIYTTVTVQTQSFKKTNPSRSYFEKLVNNPRYSSTLDCPCHNISIPYSSFISISPHYHQLCSSDFILHNSMWINLIYTGSNLSNYSYDDYRHFVVPHFRLLYYLCTIANDTLTDALLRFRSTILISTRAQSRQTVIEQTNASINQFRSSVPTMFIRTLDFIQQMAQGNGLTSSIGSNWYPIPQKENGPVSLAPRTYGKNNCSCGIKSKCVSLAIIDEWTVPGFLIGCYPLESLLQSTLECLYDITCINKLKNKHLSFNMNVCPLNRALSPANVTVQSLIDGLMVEQWESAISYDDYYASCAPVSCSYVIREQANSIYIITATIGSFGGLTTALQILSPLVVKIARYVVMWHRRRVAPTVAVIS